MTVVAVLTMSEIFRYLQVETHDHMLVDPTFGSKLRIDFNVSFHALNCKCEYADGQFVGGKWYPYK